MITHDVYLLFFFFQAEDGIRDLVRSRGLGDVYKRQVVDQPVLVQHLKRILKVLPPSLAEHRTIEFLETVNGTKRTPRSYGCLLYTSDAADERSSVDLGGRRIIKKTKISLSLIHISEP